MIAFFAEPRVLITSCALILMLASCAFGGEQGGSGANAPDTVAQAVRQFRDYTLSHSTPNLSQALSSATSLRENGSWADIDYKSTQRAAWPTSGHVSRVLTMTLALVGSKTTPEQAQTLESAIHKALAYWRENDFKCPNWWHNNIGVPKMLGPTALLLGDRLREDEFNYITKTVMPRAAIGMTGQNRVWLAGITLMDALLTKDEKKAAEAAEVIFSEVAVTNEEGIQPDFSFHQHGPQLQFGNYGLSFADDQLTWAAILRGTPWEMPPDKLAIMRHYLLDGQDWVVWKGVMDISSCGRQLSPGSPEGKGVSISRSMSKLATLDPVHAREAQASIKRNKPGGVNDLIGSRFFWRSDYLVNRRKDVVYTLKMCSKRVIGAESINSENLSGYYLADGAMYTRRTAAEYREIFPVWDWRKLPGVTCAQGDGPLPSFESYRIDSAFVGGVSDAMNACAVLDYKRDGVCAKKAWFFAGDVAVCLGCGIKADASVTSPLATAINQCRLTGDVRISENGKQSALQPGTHDLSDLQWVQHDGIRYTLLQPQHVVLSNENKTGNWSKVIRTAGVPKSDVTMGVFTLYIDHGTAPTDATYAYSIAPVGDESEAPAVISNTETIQAVRFGDLVEAVLHAPASLNLADGHALKVDAPCVLILDLSENEPKITVADPAHTVETLNVEFDGRHYKASMPKGAAAGKSVRLQR